MTHPYWPLFDLRITTQDLVLRPKTEADCRTIAEILPPDLELDPAATLFDVGSTHVKRGIVAFQGYWKAYGTWSPESWDLGFVVLHNDTIIGTQALEGERFPTIREVDSSSFLAPEARGKGFGKQMRKAVLALAFDRLGAESAITSAWHDNHASLGVSRAVGYEPNGVSRHMRGDAVDRMMHLAMSRERWLKRGYSGEIEIEGFEPCRPLFGLE